MSSIDVAMARSLRPTTWEAISNVLARNLVAQAHKRDMIGDTKKQVGDVATAFSSWDNCMQATYCKWPVIAIIIIGSLIILSILWCIVRCCCCAKSCCCGCFQCLKCCGNCCGCCDPPNSRKHKYLDEPYIPPHHGYQQQAPMQPSFHPPPPQHHGPPQYASFDTPKNQDSLPQMPSWEGASSKKVMLEEDDAVEMNHLKKPVHDPRNPRAGSPSAGVVSPMSAADGRGPYNPPNRGPPSRGPGGPGGPGRSYMANNAAPSPGGYGHRSVSPLNDQGYANNGYNQSGPGGPGSYGNNGYNNAYNQGSSQNLNAPHDYNTNHLSDGYGLDQPYDSPDVNAGGHAGGHSGAAMAGAGLAGGLAGAALAAGAMRHQSPAPGSHAHGYGTPQQQPASPYTELSAEPNPFKTPESGYVEMPNEPRRQEQPQVNVHAAFAEMSAAPTAKSPVHEAPNREPEPIAYEMGTDQVAPIELDGGYIGPAQAKHAEASPRAFTAELAAPATHSPITQNPSASSSTAQPHHDGPEVYDVQQQSVGSAGAGQYGQHDQSSRQGSMDSRSAPEGYGMRRQRTGDNGAPSPLGPQPPYGMDPRMRSSPGPMSPRSPGPRSSPGPGAGPRRGPAPRPDQPFSPSPLNTPGESPYGRPSFNQSPGPHRAYSPGPRQPRSPDHNVPVGRPNGQTAFAEPQPQSPITNNAGFDFTSGFARPQTSNSERRQPPPQQQQQQQQGYQGQPRPQNNQGQGGWNGY